MNKQNSGDDMNYIISGTGKAFCDGMEEDLVMLTIVVKK